MSLPVNILFIKLFILFFNILNMMEITPNIDEKQTSGAKFKFISQNSKY
jgi:hypothetical protein